MILKFWFNILIFLLFTIKYYLCVMESSPKVWIDNDEFKGFIFGLEKQEANSKFLAFLGIPYAKAPIGDLRFKDPQKLDKFEGNLNATEEGYECHSITARKASEDCLNLNVFTKELTPIKPLPVVVLIHPGGFYLGSGATHFMNPFYMMHKDVVLVTFNYRLGSLGFLNLGTLDIPGNAGLKDQVYALRWVQKYISNFGGNPKDITLMGYSAGALSVCLHLVSPMSKDLFQKAIIMSGSVPPQTKLPQGEQKYLAVRQLKRLNCTKFQEVKEELPYKGGVQFLDYKEIKEADIVKYLNDFSGLEIAQTLRSMFDFGKDNPIYLWLPIIEKDFGQERFLIEDFYSALKKQKDFKVHLLIGYANGEFGDSATEILDNIELKQKFNKDFETLAPRCFMYEKLQNKENITESLRQNYLNEFKEITEKDVDNLSDLFSDSIIRFGTHQIADIVSQSGGLVYFYEFKFVADPSEKYDKFPDKKARCEHMNDLQYLFNWSGKPHSTERELKTIELYSSFMYDFIKNGKLSDERARPYPQSYAQIDENIEYLQGHNFDNYKFWLQLLIEENSDILIN